jgi:ribosomal protein S18 acetylase RimI-like enzyme
VDAETEAVLGHLNLLEFARTNARWAAHHEVVDEPGVLVFAGDTDWPAFNNGVFRTDDGADPAIVLGRAREFFHARGRGYSLWVRATAADADLARAAEVAGHGKVFDYPQMIIRRRLEDRPLPEGVEIREVVDVERIEGFAEINAAAYTVYGSPAEATRSNFGRPGALLQAHVVSFVATLDGAPVSTAQTMLSHGIAGIFWVATLEAARGRGIAEAVTRVATNWGFDQGVPNVQLQASPMGESIYRRMGYEDLYRYDFYLCAGPPPREGET